MAISTFFVSRGQYNAFADLLAIAAQEGWTGGGGGSFLPLAGGTMSGDINLSSNDLLTVGKITMDGDIFMNSNDLINVGDVNMVGDITMTSNNLLVVGQITYGTVGLPSGSIVYTTYNGAELINNVPSSRGFAWSINGALKLDLLPISGTLTKLVPVFDNVFDLGQQTAGIAFRFIYVKSGVALVEGYGFGGTPVGQTDTGILFTALSITNKTELLVKFPTGSAIALATEA